MENVYERLRKKLDDLATGFPETESKVEIRILKRLFTEDEAEFFLKLSPLLEKPEDVAKRLGLDSSDTAEKMEKMAKKGLLFRHTKENESKYCAIPYVVGIFEFQLGTVDKELSRDMDEYFDAGFGKTIQAFKTPVMRAIPINREIVVNWPVAPYEDAIQIIESQKTIAITPCICRVTAKHIGRGCDKPVEACFSFGSHAHYYVENKLGRYISVEEAKEILRKNEEAGLVIQPFNSKKAGGMCSCCGDCCGMLRSLKKQPVPSAAVQSNYYAEVMEDDCTGCETCVERCQMEAIDIIDEKAKINLDRCIGCGLCVTTCPADALKLVKKPENEQYVPPDSGAETYIRIAMERGKNPLA
jgi:Na+-translocating ferredoxin:NAD+ oxidoreductase subunit B